MNIISSVITSGIYCKAFQSPAIQKIALGLTASQLGKRLFSYADSEKESSFFKRAVCKIAGLSLIGGGLFGIYEGGGFLYGASKSQLSGAFLFSEKSSNSFPKNLNLEDFLPASELPLFKHHVLSTYDNICRPGQQILFLASTGVRVGLNILKVHFQGASCLTKKLISHPLHICEAIESASKVGTINELIINTHGDSNGMVFSEENLRAFDPIPKNCFDGLAKDARITLLSCSAAQESGTWRPNIAQWLSWFSGKEVIAPTQPVGWLTLIDKGRGNPFEVRLMDSGDTRVDSTKHVFPTDYFPGPMALFGALSAYQTLRMGATIVQGSGMLAEWLTEKTSYPVRRVAETVGLYNPTISNALYQGLTGSSKLVAEVGKTTHSILDKTVELVASVVKKIFVRTPLA